MWLSLLRDADMERGSGGLRPGNPDEDPVIHFYEHFLKDYDAAESAARRVLHPAARRLLHRALCHELLQTEFGLEDGLASTTTWGEVIAASKGKAGEITLPAGAKDDDPFVQILDPATGTGTFLVECIDLIHKTMVAKWKRAASATARSRRCGTTTSP